MTQPAEVGATVMITIDVHDIRGADHTSRRLGTNIDYMPVNQS